MKRAFIIYIASWQSTMYYAASVRSCRGKCHKFLAVDDCNLSFVTHNHCHNISLNYVYSQILISGGVKNATSRLSLHSTNRYYITRVSRQVLPDNGTKKLSIEICISPCILYALKFYCLFCTLKRTTHIFLH